MNVVIRVDASIHIGSGHVMRCLVLAEGLRSQGDSVSFASRPQQGDLIEFVRSKSFEIHELMTPDEWLIPKNTADYEAWLQVPWQQDAESLIQKIDDVDLLIVDHYGLNEDWESAVKKELACKIMAIDDLVRSHKADMLLDQTLHRTVDEYDLLNSKAFVLAGCDFALIKPDFITYRKSAIKQSVLPNKTIHLLISMGGVDQPNATLHVLNILSKMTGVKPNTTVLLSEKSPHYESVKKFCQLHSAWVTHLNFRNNMAELMLKHDIAIGAPGSTAWERACLGLPSIVISLADNQKTIGSRLKDSGVAICVELDEINSTLLTAYQRLLKNWTVMRTTNLSICDGLGLLRVVQAINKLCVNTINLINLREACESDIKQVFDLQLLPETREYALTKKALTWQGHQQWMKAKLQSKGNYFYIIESKLIKQNVGVLRLDRLAENNYLLSIFIDPVYFKQGFAKATLALIDEIYPDIFIEATVLEENVASQTLFISAKYKRHSADKFIRYPIN